MDGGKIPVKREENKWPQNEYQSEGERVIHAAHSKAGYVWRDIHATRSLSDEVVTRLMAVSAISPHITSSSSSIGRRFFLSRRRPKWRKMIRAILSSAALIFNTPKENKEIWTILFFLQMDHSSQMECYCRRIWRELTQFARKIFLNFLSKHKQQNVLEEKWQRKSFGAWNCLLFSWIAEPFSGRALATPAPSQRPIQQVTRIVCLCGRSGAIIKIKKNWPVMSFPCFSFDFGSPVGRVTSFSRLFATHSVIWPSF